MFWYDCSKKIWLRNFWNTSSRGRRLWEREDWSWSELHIPARLGKLTKRRQSRETQLISSPSFVVESVSSSGRLSQCCRQSNLWILTYHLSSRRRRLYQSHNTPLQISRDHRSSLRIPAQQGHVWARRHDEFDHRYPAKKCIWGTLENIVVNGPIQDDCWWRLPSRLDSERPRQQYECCPSFNMCQFAVVDTQLTRPGRSDVTRWNVFKCVKKLVLFLSIYEDDFKNDPREAKYQNHAETTAEKKGS